MAEYIERVPFAELVEHLDKKEPCKNCYHRAACDAWVRNAKTLYDDYTYSVENCPYYVPTADVVELRHGHWIESDNLESFNTRGWKRYKKVICSHCKKSNYNNHSNYCPNCGADMRGGKK